MGVGRPLKDYGIRPGDVIERLTVLREVRGEPRPNQPLGPRCAECRCACGTVAVIALADLARDGRNDSCGCLGQERVRQAALRDGNSPEGKARMAAIGRDNRTHGLRDHPLYKIWRLKMRACYDPQYKQYTDYGGRGIRVREEWHAPLRFVQDVEAEIGPRPEGRMPSGKMPYWTIDRVDNDGDYEPGNIRWATWSEQAGNRRKRRWHKRPS